MRWRFENGRTVFCVTREALGLWGKQRDDLQALFADIIADMQENGVTSRDAFDIYSEEPFVGGMYTGKVFISPRNGLTYCDIAKKEAKP